MKNLNELIDKYNRPGPRYTSYPPVPFWANTPTEEKWIEQIRKNYNPETGLDLYVHVPYCEKLCYYCGCNRTITKNHEVEAPYLESLLEEWEIYRRKLGFTPIVNSIHFGGGTPTFLSPKNLETLLGRLTEKRRDSFFGSVEIDPRTCNHDHLKVFKETGITRVSMGIQDFDGEVQGAINRHQSIELVENLVAKVRELNFSSINFDLIYGLPKQSVETITGTMNIVGKLRPDLIAFYGYAHLPDRIKNQRLIKEGDLPAPQLKREIYETGKKILKGFGYDDIGLDHFALPGNFLQVAKEKQELHRNFMGYVDKKSTILIGLGPTSISDSSNGFIQNLKEIKPYQEAVAKGHLPIESGHTHTPEDLVAQALILNLMCNGEVKIDINELPYGDEIRQELLEFQADQLISYESGLLKLTPAGKGFMRNVAMSFDHHLRENKNKKRFSQTV